MPGTEGVTPARDGCTLSVVAELFHAEATAGLGAGLDVLPVALRRLRSRVLDICEGLADADWQRQSRCDLWTVHDVVRHVRDACHIHTAGLRSEPTPFSSGEPFDTRETPRRWLEPTSGETPEDTVAALRECGAAEEIALEARLANHADDLVGGPYGTIHWTVFSAHVFWDAWLHARDVTEVLDQDDRSTAVEEHLAALYGLLIASMPAVRRQHRFDATVALLGADGTTYFAAVEPARVTVRAGGGSDDADLRGELAPVVDSLAGRGPTLDRLLHGERSALEPLTWLRPRLAPAV